MTENPISPSASSAPSAVNTPDLLAIGHVARDLVGDRAVPGGAVTYAAHTARALGLTAAIVTSARPGDLEPAPGVAAHVVPVTCHHHLPQRLTAPAAASRPSRPSQAPSARTTCPSNGATPPTSSSAPSPARSTTRSPGSSPSSVVVAALQGWLRQWDDAGVVSPRPWDGRDVLPARRRRRSLSSRTPTTPAKLTAGRSIAPVLIVTLGDRGARLHTCGEWHDIPPFPARETDPTGAGDVFAAAYAIRLPRDPRPHRVRPLRLSRRQPLGPRATPPPQSQPAPKSTASSSPRAKAAYSSFLRRQEPRGAGRWGSPLCS